jgi:hypothetical protein
MTHDLVAADRDRDHALHAATPTTLTLIVTREEKSHAEALSAEHRRLIDLVSEEAAILRSDFAQMMVTRKLFASSLHLWA